MGAEMMFRARVLQARCALSDAQAEIQRLDRRSLGWFPGIDDGDRGAMASRNRLFARFDAYPRGLACDARADGGCLDRRCGLIRKRSVTDAADDGHTAELQGAFRSADRTMLWGAKIG